MTKDTITIIVTVYNLEPYLDRFFKNLSEQTVTDYEVLIIDDGSEDNSLAICRKYAADDERIRIIASEHIGISAARNLALSSIRTELVSSLDGDDYFDKDYLKHLLDAYKKYGADLVMSNVIYRTEEGEETDRFSERPEELIERNRFPYELPKLLTERRLNYLYGKLYKAEYLRDIRVEPDVMQGSDTMINSQYVVKINSIAVIENYDYNYIKYSVRSVTSYGGDHVFKRLYRINKFVYDVMEANDLLSSEMLRTIDGRIMYSGKIALRRIAKMPVMKREKYHRAEKITHSDEYLCSYNRQLKHGNIPSFEFGVIRPGEEKDYIKDLCRSIKNEKRYNTIKSTAPSWMFDVWHKIKK